MKSTLPPTSNTKKWRAIYTKSRTEKKVSERLLLAGFDVFLPLKTELRQWSDRKKKVQVPLIPSHVFVNSTDKDLSAVLNVFGVVSVLKYLGKPALIQPNEIDNLKIISNFKGAIAVQHTVHFEKGSLVRVVKGPFQGVLATFLMEKGKHRIQVQLAALNQSLELTIPISHIELLEPH